MRAILIIDHTNLGHIEFKQSFNNPQNKACFTSICQLQDKKKKRNKKTLLWRPCQPTGITGIVKTGQGCCITLVFFGDFVAAYPSVIGQIIPKVRALLIQTLNNRANVLLRVTTAHSYISIHTFYCPNLFQSRATHGGYSTPA